MTQAGPASGPRLNLHATTVALGRRALLIRGPSGSGKTSLALRLMSLGAGLVADDRTILTKTPDGPPIASAPDVIRGLIEAYGVGVLRVEPAPPASLVAVADLGEIEAERIPPRRTTRLIDWELDLFHKPETGPFHDVLFLYLTGKACLT